MGNPKVVAASGATYTKLADQREDVVTSLADSGAPEGVFAPRDYDLGEYDVEDMAAGFLRLENDATISIRASWAANLPDGTGGTLIMGTKGGLTFNPLTFIGTLGHYQAGHPAQCAVRSLGALLGPLESRGPLYRGN